MDRGGTDGARRTMIRLCFHGAESTGKSVLASKLASELRALHGVVDTGLFIDLTDEVVVAGASGVRFLRGLAAP